MDTPSAQPYYERFLLPVASYNQTIRLQVERIYQCEEFERYKISDSKRSVVVRTNLNKVQRLKSKRGIEWKVEEGEVRNEKALAFTLYTLERYLTGDAGTSSLDLGGHQTRPVSE